ncbi:MAG: hypothetical protein JXB00_16485 [Bacteroidales bacterium]|nr:hypothetical protein [Bacteroidales bacterium]
MPNSLDELMYYLNKTDQKSIGTYFKSKISIKFILNQELHDTELKIYEKGLFGIDNNLKHFKTLKDINIFNFISPFNDILLLDINLNNSLLKNMEIPKSICSDGTLNNFNDENMSKSIIQIFFNYTYKNIEADSIKNYGLLPPNWPKKLILNIYKTNDYFNSKIFAYNLDSINLIKPLLLQIDTLINNSKIEPCIQDIYLPLIFIERHQLIHY